MIPEDQKIYNYTTPLCSKGRHFTAATQTLNTSCSKELEMFNRTEMADKINRAWSSCNIYRLSIIALIDNL